MNERFFGNKQAGAVLKHDLLVRYLTVFTSKVGSKAAGGKVYFLDGYAGPGKYDDGGTGSPSEIAELADKLSQMDRTVHGIYVERDKKACEKLREVLAGTKHVHEVKHGVATDFLDEILEEIGPEAPLFAFFDPCGLLLPLDDVVKTLKRSQAFTSTGSTEVLLNFVYAGMWRTIGVYRSVKMAVDNEQSRDSTIARLNDVYGGDWWQKVCDDNPGEGGTELCRRLARMYLKKLVAQLSGPWGWRRIFVSQKWEGATTYELFFITTYPDEGMWQMAEALSSAYDTYRSFWRDQGTELSTDEEYNEQLVADAKKNILKLLKDKQSVPVNDLAIRYSDTGYMREKHIRKAINELAKKGRVKKALTGKLQHQTIERA